MKYSVKVLFMTLTLLIGSNFVLAKKVIKVGHGASESYHMHKAWLKFSDVLKDLSNGNIVVEIFPNGQVGGDRELIESVQSGIIDMTSPSSDILAGWDTVYSITGLPFIFEDRASALRVLNGDLGKALLENAVNLELVGLGWMENGVRQITNNKRAIRTPDDLKGVKIRTMQVAAHIELFKLMGANPTPMSFNEVYSALQQGVIDGQENPLGHIYQSRFYEVQNFLTMSEHVYTTHIVLANPDFYANFTDEEKSWIDQALKQAVDYQQDLVTKEEDADLAAIEKAGLTITRLTIDERKAFQQISLPLIDQFRQKIDKKWFELLDKK
ncbi:2,3-diketo-L-gulonate-binding periplasmic protein [Gammaproteobacteria bacterium]|nr:2,3-diketo-L-gulonate-binding periplasmic protein [Gammaproteobacteria bacterium]